MEKEKNLVASTDANNVYRKVNGRYIPFGVFCSDTILSDGLWYVRHKDHSRALTNVDYIHSMVKVGDRFKDKITIEDICSVEEYSEYIMESDEFRNLLKGSYSITDLVHLCVSKSLERTREIKEAQA